MSRTYESKPMIITSPTAATTLFPQRNEQLRKSGRREDGRVRNFVLGLLFVVSYTCTLGTWASHLGRGRPVHVRWEHGRAISVAGGRRLPTRSSRAREHERDEVITKYEAEKIVA